MPLSFSRLCVATHKLADSGEDLFGKENARIRGRLSKHGIQGKLSKRVREFKKIIDDNPDLVESLVNGLKAQSIENCLQAEQMKEKITVFDKLRSAMHIALPDEKLGWCSGFLTVL